MVPVPVQRQESEHISGCKCHVGAERWLPRAFDVSGRSEHNSQSAVTAFHSLMIHSIHAGGGQFAHVHRGAAVLCQSIWAQFLPLDDGGACQSLIRARDLFLPEVLFKQSKLDCEDCQLFCACIKTLTPLPMLHINAISSPTVCLRSLLKVWPLCGKRPCLLYWPAQGSCGPLFGEVA